MIAMTDRPIRVDAVLQAVEASNCGAVALFLGTVRDHSGDVPCSYLEYEAYPRLAEKTMQEIADAARRQWPIAHIAMVHRTGRLEIGEISVAVAVSSAHRGPAFEACRYCIDTLKQTVPIWKKEVGPDGESWIEGPDAIPRPTS